MTDILIHGIIGRNVRSGRIKQELASISDPVISINSEGGDTFEMIAIFNAINDDPRDIPVLIEGRAFSAGGIIALAGKPIRMKENALLMLHGIHAALNGLSNKEDLKDTLSLMEKTEDGLVKMIMSRTNKNRAEVESILSKDSFFTASEALANGLIDEIVPVGRRSLFNLEGLDNAELPASVIQFANSFNKRKESSMALKDLVNKFGIKVDDAAEDSVLENSLVDYVNTLSTRIGELEKNPPKEKDKPKTKIPSGLMNMARNYRNQSVDSLLKDGKITANVASKLKEKYATDTHLQNCLSIDDENQDVEDDFEEVVGLFNANDKVLNLEGGRTGVQPVDNPLFKDVPEKEIHSLLANRMVSKFGEAKSN